MKTYRCPVCKKPLTKTEYERALGILGARERHLQHQTAKLRTKLKQAQVKAREAKEEGKKAERARTHRLLQGKDRTIQTLKERIDQLMRGSTPQTEGLEFEDKLVARLRREFSEDQVLHKGRGGDVLHIVRFDERSAGTIIYECKREKGIKSAHIRQARLAKQSREADFAVLVTIGHRKGFVGLAQRDGVLVVHPLGVIPLVSLLRLHLIEMLRARVAKKRRAIIAERLVGYITSPQFKNPIEEVVHLTAELQEMVRDEAKDHLATWRKRWNYYQKINWDASQVRTNVQLVLHGKEPKAISHPKAPPLQLPASTQ
jgi:hypothetical protein